MKYLWTTVYVRNLDESIAFYSDLVGLKVVQRFPAGPGKEIAFMGNGLDNETLVELMADNSKKETGFTGSISLGFAVESVDEMLHDFQNKKIAIHTGPFETPSFKFFTIQDPNGLDIQFFQRK